MCGGLLTVQSMCLCSLPWRTLRHVLSLNPPLLSILSVPFPEGTSSTDFLSSAALRAAKDAMESLCTNGARAYPKGVHSTRYMILPDAQCSCDIKTVPVPYNMPSMSLAGNPLHQQPPEEACSNLLMQARH